MASRAVPSALWRSDRPEVVFRSTIVLLAVGTGLVVLVPAFHGHVVAPVLDLVLDTTSTIVAASVAVLLWIRFGERREAIGLYQAAAFFGLAVAYGTAVIVSVGDGRADGLGAPSAGQVVVFAVARLLAAVLLVVGGTAMRGRKVPTRPIVVLLAPALIVALVAVLGRYVTAIPGPLQLVVMDRADGLPRITETGAFVQIITATLFFEAAFVMRSLWRLDRIVMDGWVAIALVFAGFAEIHWIVYPSGHPGHISTADVLRLAFFVSLVVGIEAEARVTLRRFRLANVELVSLRDAVAESAALEERARLARELHDGLAQDLWLAKLKTAQLGGLPSFPADARPLLAEAEGAIENGLTEARQAVMAMRAATEAGEGFCAVMQRYVQDFEERFGLRVEFSTEGEIRDVGTRTQAEILRIAQEALTNVRHHASATVVGVRLAVSSGRISLRVADNGCGFDPRNVAGDRYGLASMRERAALIGGRLQVKSTPGLGTVVLLSAPLAGRPSAVPAAGFGG